MAREVLVARPLVVMQSAHLAELDLALFRWSLHLSSSKVIRIRDAITRPLKFEATV